MLTLEEHFQILVLINTLYKAEYNSKSDLIAPHVLSQCDDVTADH